MILNIYQFQTIDDCNDHLRKYIPLKVLAKTQLLGNREYFILTSQYHSSLQKYRNSGKFYSKFAFAPKSSKFSKIFSFQTSTLSLASFTTSNL